MSDKKNPREDLSLAITGFWKAIPVGVASIGGVWWMHRANMFPKMQVSAKICLAIAPPIGAWSYFSEMEIFKAISDKEEKQVTVSLPFQTRAVNYFYENTLAAYLGLVVPCYGVVLAQELAKPRYPGWMFSHALVHTRVIGQAIAVGALVVVFGTRETLKRNGAPFGVDKDDAFYNQ